MTAITFRRNIGSDNIRFSVKSRDIILEIPVILRCLWSLPSINTTSLRYNAHHFCLT